MPLFSARLQAVADRLKRSDDLKIGSLVLVVGAMGGLGSVVFRDLISWVHDLFFGGGGKILGFLGGWYVILVPAVGMALVSWIVNRWALEAKGHGVPEVQYAVRKEGGLIRPRVALVKILASALCIGTGGSVGREGPIVQIGSTLGSILGRFMRLPRELVKLLVGCGAAAGISGTFNAPIAGAFFTLEIILGNFNGRAFGFVVLSSVTGAAIRRALIGNTPSFALTEVFQLRNWRELPLYFLMGLLLGLLAALFVRIFYWVDDRFEKARAPRHLKAAAGGLAVGLLGYFGSPTLFGVGYDGIDLALHDSLAVKMLLLLVVLKILATSISLGSGGSGGIFAPALFIGAMAGGAYGTAVNALFPGVCAPPGAYALVGMAALFAGTAHAPITAIVILFEMTNDYRVILPLMLAAVVCYFFSSTLSPDSIYLIKLRRLGGLLPDAESLSLLDNLLVADAMTTEPVTVRSDEKIGDFAGWMYRSPHRSFPVVDGKGRLVGMVTERQASNALASVTAADRAISDIMTRNLITCTPRQSLRSVMETFKEKPVQKIPVVDPRDPQVLLGLLSREDILWAYGELSEEHRLLKSRSVPVNKGFSP